MPKSVGDDDEYEESNEEDVEGDNSNEIIGGESIEEVIDVRRVELFEELSHDEDDDYEEGDFVVEGLLVEDPGVEEQDVFYSDEVGGDSGKVEKILSYLVEVPVNNSEH